MRILDGIGGLAGRYDGFVLDLWGVVHDGAQPYPGVLDALARLRALGKRVCFLTNAPRRAALIAAQIGRMGVTPELYDGIMSSGELTWRYLDARRTPRADPWFARLGSRAFHIGPAREHRGLLDGLGIDVAATPDAADFVLNTGPDPERGPLSVEPYLPILAECARHRLPMLCVNPDRAVMVRGQRLICAGALSERYQIDHGGDVFEVGKPDPQVYPPVLEVLGIADRSRVLAVGDTPHTDLAGAEAAGLDAAWALTGLAGDEHGEDPSPELLAKALAVHALTPVAAIRALRW
ncbi:TIGR01459 family HAD-type hydrolase [Roseomonas sp. NAR14]|uniref:TIGR01459 family HAD-type hydrolase n=1 Tax=Roseomonas acroporae TaxID=2937791 RepID=A0A9X1YA71_9PROT|nr:TIGR01459 family HAD-type hydrolase [Roseomonas acroporae]MCK8784952.1 TIGR01459 family HAD-type hydrolase [Roseomonas acroporae]